MTISFVTTPAELYRANLSHTLRGRVFWICIALFLFVFPAFVVWRAMSVGYPPGDAVRSQLGFIVVMWAYMILGTPLLLRWTSGRAWRASPGVKGDQVYELTPEGVRIRNPVAEATLQWTGIVKVVETKEFFFLYVGRTAHFLPKRAIADEQLPALRALLREHAYGPVRLMDAPAAA